MSRLWLLKNVFNIKVIQLLHIYVTWHTISTQAICSFLDLQWYQKEKKNRSSAIKKDLRNSMGQKIRFKENTTCSPWIKNINNELTLDIALAVSTQAFFGLLTIELTFKSRSSSAVFWDCQASTEELQNMIFWLNNLMQNIPILYLYYPKHVQWPICRIRKAGLWNKEDKHPSDLLNVVIPTNTVNQQKQCN